tara:strand:+ start:318 stop:1757 length:1440 start_codon:yes stop_codon:yes gene_type:complete
MRDYENLTPQLKKGVIVRTKTEIKKVSIAKLAKLQSNNKIYLDDSFQSYDRWSITEKQEYICSILEGRAVTSIILASIDSLCSSLKLMFGEDNEDYLFFKSLKDKGYEYVTIDGNNRSRCIADFIDDGFPLAEKEYETDGDYLSFYKAKKENKYYTTLPADAKDFIDNISMNLLVVSKADRIGLASLFIAVNKGMNLNPQEKRNAIMCVFGDYVRKLSDDLNEGFKKIFTKNALNRRFADEMIVTASVIVANGIDNVGGVARDAAYTDTSKELKSFTAKVIPIMNQIVNDMVIPYGVGGIKIDGMDSGNFIDLIMLLDYMQMNSIYIDDYKLFYEWFILSQSSRVDSGEILYEGSKGTNKRTYSGLLRGTGKSFLKIRLDMLIESLSTIPEGVVTFRDEVRAFDSKLRYKFWKRQDGICPLMGEYIEPRFIWDTRITHLDHDMPWSKSGETSEENGQLTFAQANLSKGNEVFESVVEEI